jgi:putative ABC transport system permease protein
MWKSYLKIALRAMRKQKVYAFINIFGLAVGLAFCALIFLFVHDELSFDRCHEKRDRIYRLSCTEYRPDGGVDRIFAWQPMPLGPALKAEFPEVEEYVRFQKLQRFVRGSAAAVKEDVLFADPSVLEVFTFPLLRGDPKTALADPKSVVLSAKAARKYFGDSDPSGQSLGIRLADRFEDFAVSGVAQDVPANSTVSFDILAPFAALGDEDAGKWDSSNSPTCLLLRSAAAAGRLEEKLVEFRARHYPDEPRRLRELNWSGGGPWRRFGLQPLLKVHLDTTVAGGSFKSSDPAYSYILTGIALLVLVIAGINFMTLAIGRSAGRAREIGIRKVVGARRGQLAGQFWGEAFLQSLLAMAVGLGLAQLVLPVFNLLTGKTLSFGIASRPEIFLGLLGLALAAGLLAGSYPALVLSGFRPVETLKNRLRLGGSNLLTRSLVVAQFALSVVLIASTLVMLEQLRQVRTKNLGYDKENVVVVSLEGVEGARTLELLRHELRGRSGIAGLTGVSLAFEHGISTYGFKSRGGLKEVHLYRVQADYLDTLGMKLAAGRGFDESRATDAGQAVIINETMARYLGLAEPLGQTIDGLYLDKSRMPPTVIGIVKDYNFRSLHSPIEPLALTLSKDDISYLMARLRPGGIQTALAALRAAWAKVSPDVPFTFSFLDEDLDHAYKSEERWSRIVGYGSLFAIIVACLGLFGLSALTAAKRTKEIGVRKILGASIPRVTLLLSKEFAVLVVIASALAVPPAWFAVRAWLGRFAFRAGMRPELFFIAGGLALAVAVLTVGFQSVRAATRNPVDSLRYE